MELDGSIIEVRLHCDAAAICPTTITRLKQRKHPLWRHIIILRVYYYYYHIQKKTREY